MPDHKIKPNQLVGLILIGGDANHPLIFCHLPQLYSISKKASVELKKFKRSFAHKSEALKFELKLKKFGNKKYIRAQFQNYFIEV